MTVAEARPPEALVSFVGAGPGDPELITLKGLRRLRAADVVIHDRLIPAALLVQARPDAEIIDAGKAPGRHCPAQEDINRLIVDRATRGGRVVRLKGGDPSLFGRLGEELAAVRAAGLPFEVIPGVTAATAAAAPAGISLTERRSASTVVLATGTDHTGRPATGLDWELLARPDVTAVFYMAVRGLDTITTALRAFGRDPREPALVVERAWTPAGRILAGGLGDIAGVAREAGAEAPALLIVGPTVAAAGAMAGAGAGRAGVAVLAGV
ncbi:MAG: uroporphyrinogen-III C-methyltransferase [Candidatus Rokubacteria bacterium]|nr:uroporphyrinogen-III C-methyltransferase [Candidatus Rokubacteria bacterium]